MAKSLAGPGSPASISGRPGREPPPPRDAEGGRRDADGDGSKVRGGSRGPRPRRGLRALRGHEGLTTLMDTQLRRWNLKGGLERGRAAARDALRRLAAVLALVLQVRPRRPVPPPPPPPRAPRIAFRRAPRRPPVFGPPVFAVACPCPRPHWTRRPSPPVASPRATDRPRVLRGARRPAATGARVGGARREASRGGERGEGPVGHSREGHLGFRGGVASRAGGGGFQCGVGGRRGPPEALARPSGAPPARGRASTPAVSPPRAPCEGHLRRRPRLRVVGWRCLPGRWASVASFEKRPRGRTDRGGRRADPRCARVRSGW